MKTQLNRFYVVLTGALVALSASSSLFPASAKADEHHRGRGHVVDWGRGRWVHDRRDGRLGWWWVVGSNWTYYERPHSFIQVGIQPAPVVIQQAPPPPVMIEQAPPQVVMQAPPAPMAPVAPPVSPVLYYCRATGTHYPETMSCPGGWSTMTAETPPQP